jgi:FecR protein
MRRGFSSGTRVSTLCLSARSSGRSGGGMQRREFLTFLAAATASGRVAWPSALQAQDQASSKQGAGDQIGQVATLQGSATVTRGIPVAAAGLRVNDFIFKNDTLETGVSSTLGVTLDDETTFSLSANTRIAVDEFVYQQGGSANAALFTVARGTAAFLASKVASTGDMKNATPIATMGIRGTTGVVDVPEAGTAGEPKIKLYPDADGHVGRIEVFDRQGAQLGILTQGRARLRCAAEPAAAWRRSRFRFRRRKRCATAAYCSGSLPPIQSVSIRPSNAGNRASATGNGRTSCGGPAVLRAAKHSRPAGRATDPRAARARSAAGAAAQAQSVRAKTEVVAFASSSGPTRLGVRLSVLPADVRPPLHFVHEVVARFSSDPPPSTQTVSLCAKRDYVRVRPLLGLVLHSTYSTPSDARCVEGSMR